MYRLLLAIAVLSCFPASSHARTYKLDENHGRIPVTFTPNVGQFDSSVVFSMEGNADGELSGYQWKDNRYQKAKTILVLSPYPGGSEALTVYGEVNGMIYSQPTYRLSDYQIPMDLRFLNAEYAPDVIFEDQVPWNSNYFIGSDSARWRTDVPQYNRFRLENIYPGIDIVGTGDNRSIDFTMVIHPGADPSDISFTCDSARYLFNEYYDRPFGTLTIDENGALIYTNCTYGSSGDYIYQQTVTQAAPRCWQTVGTSEIDIDLRYYFIDEGNRIVGFDFGEYDPSQELTLALQMVTIPFMMSYVKSGTADIAVDDGGGSYHAGYAEYRDYPKYISTHSLCVFKLAQAGNAYEYVTYFGSGSQHAEIAGIEIDSEGNAYVAGMEYPGFPTTHDAVGNNESVYSDIFLMKLSAQGNNLDYSGFVGGSKYEFVSDVVSDDNGNAVLIGSTRSHDFPTTPETIHPEFIQFDQGQNEYDWNGFVTILNCTSGDLVSSTFINPRAGYSSPIVSGVQVDQAGSVFIAGSNEEEDVYVVKLAADLSDTVYTVTFGGSDDEYVAGVDIDENGDMYIVGTTESEDFYPEGLFEDNYFNGGDWDCFVARITNDGTVAYRKFIGGESTDEAHGIAVDGNGNAYIIGVTRSDNFPITAGALRMTRELDYDAFMTVIDPTGSEILYSTYIQNTGYGEHDIALRGTSEVILSGTGGGGPLDENLYDDRDAYTVLVKVEEINAVHESANEPAEFTVFPPFPNPFNASVSIEYVLSQRIFMTVDIYNIQGQHVASLVNQPQSIGIQRITWDAHDMPSGMYFCRIASREYQRSEKILLLK